MKPQITHQIHTHFYWPDQSWPTGRQRLASACSIVLANALMIFGIWRLDWAPSTYLLMLWFDMVLVWGLFSARVALRHRHMRQVALSMAKFQFVAVFAYGAMLWALLLSIRGAQELHGGSMSVAGEGTSFMQLSWIPFVVLTADLVLSVVPLQNKREQIRQAWSESPGFWVFYAPFYQEAMMRTVLLIFGMVVIPLVVFGDQASDAVRLSFLIGFALFKIVVDLYWTSAVRVRKMKKRMVRARKKKRRS